MYMFKKNINVALFLVASVVFGATAVAQTSLSTPANSTSSCTVTTMNHFWQSGGSSNKEHSGFCVFSTNDEWVFIFFRGNTFECNASGCSAPLNSPPNPSNDTDTIAFIDGNLTIRDEAGNLLDTTNTLGHNDAFIQVQDNGGIFMYNDKCTVLVTLSDPSNAPTTCVVPSGD
jgi:hypothetical protein